MPPKSSTSPKAFGASDRPTCPQCGGHMYVTRRSPHPEHPSAERQNVSCVQCDHQVERNVLADGTLVR